MSEFVRTVAGLWFFTWAVATSAFAQTGVSDDRVNLPDGPGSVDGFGDNADVNENMGLMAYGLPIVVPDGFQGATPELSLVYGSGTGNTALGMGWDLPVPFIERATVRGLPRYGADDEFVADGTDQLVEVVGSEPPTYRSRFERAFVRYRWHARGDGSEGYWTAEHGDGTVGYFGADREGNLIAEARSSHPDRAGTFRYYLVEQVDPFAHVVRYRYGRSRAPGVKLPLLRRVEYAFDDAGVPHYAVELTYGPRADVVSDCKPGFCEELGDRLALVDVYAGGTAIRRYTLGYEEAGAAGLSRLTSVERRGTDGRVFEGVFRFTYSRTLGEQCSDCGEPYLVDMSRAGVGVDVRGGYATLVDINGDGLPDLLDTRGGEHTFYLNELAADGSQSFAPGYPSARGEVSGFELSVPNTQVLDVDGDGLADLVNRISQHYLRNDGSGDWASYEAVAAGDESPDLSVDFEPGDSQLAHVRFLDYDNDKRIDLLRSLEAGGVTMFRNDGTGSFTVDADAEDIGYGFDSGALQLSDMNGDGLLDPVRVLTDRIEFRLHLGFAHWGPWQGADVSIAPSDVPLLELEDLNGDQLSDLVIVQNDTLRYALNRNGAAFDDWVTIDQAGGIPLPTRGATTAVLYADMNGNGSADVLWADGSGLLTYLELFPVRPNLLTQVRNGLGAVTDVTYGASVAHMARAETPWKYKVPNPMVVVDAVDVWDELSQQHEVTRYDYADGFYAGAERRFRGYERVQHTVDEDADQEAAAVVTTFDVGATDPYRAGLALTRATFAVRDGQRVPLEREVHTFEDCPVAGADDTVGFAVRHVCERALRTTVQEGAAEADWATLETRMEYDGYGATTRVADLGVVGMGQDGQGSCAPCDTAEASGPCGEACTGDERYDEVAYVEPGEATGQRWFLGLAYRHRVRGAPDSERYAEELTYYDGDAFVGLPLGQLTHGLVSRTTVRRDEAGANVTGERNRHDVHGNLLESIDPLGALDGDSHRQRWTYDARGLLVTAVEVPLASASGEPYALRREYRYDPLWDEVSEATSWMVVRGSAQSPRNSEYIRYDAFGRPAARILPGGDTPESPSEVYRYEVGAPVSRIVVQRRSQVGGPLDLEAYRCIDGHGNLVQDRTRLSSGRFQVVGFSVYNARDQLVRAYQPYESEASACDATLPDVPFTAYRYDALDRLVESLEPDAETYGTASTSRVTHRPLATLSYDEEDADPQSPFFDTPLVTRTDGLGRTVAVERRLAAGDDARRRSTTRFAYDELGRLASIFDGAGHVKRQRYDLMGRLLEVEDPNSGRTRFSYDDAGNLLTREDARGQLTRMQYDGANRLVQRDQPGSEGTGPERRTYDVSDACAACENGAGRLVSIQYDLGGGLGEGLDVAGYDARGRIDYRARTVEGRRFETTYRYDDASRLTEVTYPDGTALRNHYDDGGRLRAVEGLLDTIEYDARGLVADIARADGTRTERRYDARMRLRELRTRDADGAVLQGVAYTRDRVDNIVGARDLTEAASATVLQDAAFQYDAWYRITEERYGAGSPADERVATRFDGVDNVLARTSSRGAPSAAHVGDYTYGARPNAVAQAGATAYAYDPAGQMVERGGLRLAWDAQGRLTRATRGGQLLAEYGYGPGHERVVKREDGGVTHYLSPEFELRDGVSVTYVRLGHERLARTRSTALQTALLDDLNADDAIGAGDAWLAQRAGDEEGVPRYLRASARRLLVESEPAQAQLHADSLGSITLATVDGKVRGERAYYPTGQLRAERGYVDAYGFTGQESDGATGLTSFRFRELDTASGRWASSDPAFERLSPEELSDVAEATCGYAYVGNNGVNYYDPAGLGRTDNRATRAHKAKAASKRHHRRTANRTWVKLKISGTQGVPKAYHKLVFRQNHYKGNLKIGVRGDYVTPDHIPSFAAVRHYLNHNFNQGITGRSSAQAKRLEAVLPTINMGEAAHKAGRTFGRKNKREQYQADGHSLATLKQAARRDLDAYVQNGTMTTAQANLYHAAFVRYADNHLSTAPQVSQLLKIGSAIPSFP